ncbi:hypothetical protein GCM10011507_28850 [Edaphobacter acidisoli]|uniref:DUF2905 domain-containing protein n=1 Tax=Edaphobacter acidisoli TaxID=2040573 RepID=A0A916W846_9BACT|nr:DUF2905 domain-containing protein [Edaphobacter acidisoli]GGA75714.1 hypothetical protein GCM10011507_28850 [Edaphobacter acidisoli]
MSDLGRILIIFGIILVVAGFVVIVLARMHLPLGRLPGDLTWHGRGWSVSFPIVTCILLSVIVSLILWIIGRFRP